MQRNGRTRRRVADWLLAGVVGLTAWVAPAGADPGEAGALVEFANFGCPDCQAMRPHHAAIRSAAEEAGLLYRYAPIPLKGSYETAWEERAYYAARELPGMEKQVRRALLTSDGEAGDDGLDSVIGALSMHVPEVEWDAFAQDYIDQPASLEALERALALMKRAEIREVPAYVLVTTSGVRVIPSSAEDAGKRASKVIEFLEEYD